VIFGPRVLLVLNNTGELPIIGVNTLRDPEAKAKEAGEGLSCMPLARATQEEMESQLKRLSDFKKRGEKEAPEALELLQKVALSGANIFAEIMNAVRVSSLGQITQALFEVGGQYRRNM
jgi:methylmalonyl-CoA mutase